MKSLTHFLSNSWGKLTVLFGSLFFSSLATAGSATGAGVDNVLDEVVLVLDGPLGKLIILISVAWGIFKVLQTDWIQVMGAFLAGIVLANIEDVVDATGVGATINQAQEAMAPIVTTASVKAQQVAGTCADLVSQSGAGCGL